MRFPQLFAVAVAVLLGVVTPSLAQTPPPPASAAAPPADQAPAPSADTFANVEANYVLGLGDVVDVGIVGRSEYSARVRVSSEGSVTLPLIGSQPAVGLKPSQLADQIRAALEKGGYYSQPVMRVEVVQVASRFVTVLGQVGSPGLITLDRSYRLSEILARVGAKIGGGGDYVVLTRGGAQQRLAMTEIATGTADQDPFVSAGDKIYVPPAENEVFYVSGSVKAPGAFPLSSGMTVRTALARAGGVTDNGNEKKFDIYRSGVKVPKPTLETEVKVGDIIKFGERMF